MRAYFRVPTQNSDPGFIEALAALVRGSLARGPGLCSFAGGRVCPRPHADCPHARAGIAPLPTAPNQGETEPAELQTA